MYKERFVSVLMLSVAEGCEHESSIVGHRIRYKVAGVSALQAQQYYTVGKTETHFSQKVQYPSQAARPDSVYCQTRKQQTYYVAIPMCRTADLRMTRGAKCRSRPDRVAIAVSDDDSSPVLLRVIATRLQLPTQQQ
eukprot:IDg11364t1